MKRLFIVTAAIFISTSVLAGNMSESENMNVRRAEMKNKQSIEKILQNEDMQRLHRDMTVYGMSEVGMEARLKMISTNEGRAYHKALQKTQKNTAG
ncbi:hypothetical protein BKP64_05875 [Marinobacter salinus]|uniref:Uncharacterized protein n=1 Tax=Marinobacter salinus TaxID=1874317 RepID=A0A1D9GJD2_9GAMM|nr:hypothetical protein [Marinobacter salinus]AOY87737.1 hypothetical protein BKP64_05875 [Marinobacter salinus]